MRMGWKHCQKKFRSATPLRQELLVIADNVASDIQQFVMGFRHAQGKIHHHEQRRRQEKQSNVFHMWRRSCLLLSGSLIKDSSSSVVPVSTLNFAACCMIVSLPICPCNAQGMGININIASKLCSYEFCQGMFPTLLLWLTICILTNLGKWHPLEMTAFYLKESFQ